MLGPCYNRQMDPQVEALRRLIDSTPGGKNAVAEKSGLSEGNLGQIYAGTKLPSGRPRGIGPGTFEKLTAAYPDWLKPAPITLGLRLSVADAETAYKEDSERIPEYATGGRMGSSGLVLRDQPGEIKGWDVTKEWLRKNVPNCTSHSNLAIVTGFGDSMRPMYNPGDPLLVDRGVLSVDFDAIYFFRVGDEGFIKRLQRIPGSGLLAISENSSYRDWTITPEMDFEVFGRVIKVWRGEDF